MKATNKKTNSVVVVSSSKKIIKTSEHHIRQRAFEIFLDRYEDEGNEITDWIQAEHELNRPKKNV